MKTLVETPDASDLPVAMGGAYNWVPHQSRPYALPHPRH
jgi:hypothetical protein